MGPQTFTAENAAQVQASGHSMQDAWYAESIINAALLVISALSLSRSQKINEGCVSRNEARLLPTNLGALANIPAHTKASFKMFVVSSHCLTETICPQTGKTIVKLSKFMCAKIRRPGFCDRDLCAAQLSQYRMLAFFTSSSLTCHAA